MRERIATCIWVTQWWYIKLMDYCANYVSALLVIFAARVTDLVVKIWSIYSYEIWCNLLRMLLRSIDDGSPWRFSLTSTNVCSFYDISIHDEIVDEHFSILISVFSLFMKTILLKCFFFTKNKFTIFPTGMWKSILKL